MRALHAAGVPVLAGTDTMNPFVVPGASLHEELRLLAGAGLGAEGALAAATRGAAAALGRPDLGRLAPGAAADAAIFREDPTRDLAALDSLEAVVAGGRLLSRDGAPRGRGPPARALRARPLRAALRGRRGRGASRAPRSPEPAPAAAPPAAPGSRRDAARRPGRGAASAGRAPRARGGVNGPRRSADARADQAEAPRGAPRRASWRRSPRPITRSPERRRCARARA